MRTMNWLGVSLGIATLATVAQGVGCYHVSSDCEIFACASSSSGTGGGTSSSSGTGGGGTGGTPIACVPSEAMGPVDESCGVFVSSSLGTDDMAADRGSKAKPYKSLGAALAKSSVTRVYACAEQFTETVTVAAKVDLYGGLDCKSWEYVGPAAKTQLTAAADAIPLTLASTANGMQIDDFAITAAGAKKDGGSSIAVIVDQATASFARCDLVAGAGKAGLAGTTPTDSVGPNDPTNSDIVGNNGAAACMSTTKNDGGLPKENALCPAASGGPIGGIGGNGLTTNGSNGDVNPANAQTALGGAGQPSSDPMSLWSCVNGNGGGTGGVNGSPGAAGPGASGAMSLGTLDKSGYTGIAGQPGGPGSPGQGGGGGGGAKGKMSCAGASGGGGGAGGCGGNGGLGGLPGGASIALVSLGATLSFDKVTIKAGAGGSGGDGGVGQGGGVGGNGGNGGSGDASAPATLAACNGGKGGQGGFGGKGGGGRGGHAIGIAYTGMSAPATKGATFTKGTSGKGGAGADMAHNGDDGVQADVQAFP